MQDSQSNLAMPKSETVRFRSFSHSSWRIADLSILGVWLTLVSLTLCYHEKWADEAQAWLIARDLNLTTMWLKELRYEGTPGLWHTILWIAQHVFHLPYGAIGIIGMTCAAAGVAFVLWRAPFPRMLRYMLVFSYFMLFQYAAIARPYTLLPLLAFVAADSFKNREHPERITLALVLLSLLSLHGILIALGIGAAYLAQAESDWAALSGTVKKRYFLCVFVFAATLLFVYLVLKPPPDVDALGFDPKAWHASQSAKLTSILSGALLDFILPSALFLLYAGIWCFLRRKLLAFLLPVVSSILLYVFIHGQSHHHGTLFITVITGLWIAWPTPEEQAALDGDQRRATQIMTALLAILFAVNIWDAAVSIRYEYLYPYCGAEDAAKYLRSVGADKQSVFGYTYGEAAVQAYFDRNVFQNMPTTYFHHGAPHAGADIDWVALQAIHPEYVVLFTGAPIRELPMVDPSMRTCGYEMVHFSDGYLFFKRSLMDRQVYAVYRRLP